MAGLRATVDASHLREALKRLRWLGDKAHLRIKTTPEGLRLEACNQFLHAAIDIEAASAKGAVAVPLVKLFYALSLASGPVDISTTTRVSFAGDGCRFSLLPAEWLTPEIQGPAGIPVDIEMLREVLARILPFMSKDVSRPMFNGVRLFHSEGAMMAEAIDGYRMVRLRVCDAQNFPPVSIPSGSIGTIWHILDISGVEGDNGGKFCGTSGSLYIQSGDASISMRVLDGIYPNTNSLVQRDNFVHLRVDHSCLYHAVEAGKHFAESQVMALSKKGAVFFGAPGEISTVKLDQEWLGADALWFNPKFVAGALPCVDSDTIELLTNKANPATVQIRPHLKEADPDVPWEPDPPPKVDGNIVMISQRTPSYWMVELLKEANGS